jgi:hypothetical protein
MSIKSVTGPLGKVATMLGKPAAKGTVAHAIAQAPLRSSATELSHAMKPLSGAAEELGTALRAAHAASETEFVIGRIGLFERIVDHDLIGALRGAAGTPGATRSPAVLADIQRAGGKLPPAQRNHLLKEVDWVRTEIDDLIETLRDSALRQPA